MIEKCLKKYGVSITDNEENYAEGRTQGKRKTGTLHLQKM